MVLIVLAGIFAILALLFTVGAVGSLRGRRWFGGLVTGLLAALLFTLAALAGTLTLGIQGYRALTEEVVAATVHTRPVGARQFQATINLADGSSRSLALAGDAFYVDAHILKWHPVANMFGLHTVYELDRVGGRYNDLGAERSAPRTIHSLAQAKPVDAFHLARRFPFLKPFVDAEYGSATFISARRPDSFEVRVSTTGLLVRRLGG
jgi:hypothetical protein